MNVLAQETSTAVRVAVRARPLVAQERTAGSQSCITTDTSRSCVTLGRDRRFTFDNVFGPQAPQQLVYDRCVANLVDSCFAGYNATVFAYGQTSSGKTHTMGGACHLEVLPEERGIIPRVIRQLFDTIIRESKRAQFSVRVQYLEIWSEEVRDLLHPDTSTKAIAIREATDGQIVVAGARDEPAAGYEEAMRLLELGSLSRTTGSTHMNEHSSRSHAIFTIALEQQVLPAAGCTEAGEFMSAKLHLVDLAGSERNKKTGAAGLRFKESITINQGLLALGNVISALGDETKKATHVPYRQSKLTRMLQDSLGGNSRTLMIACLSVADTHLEESLNTLKYANRARNIKNRPHVNRERISQPVSHQEEIQALQLHLQQRQMEAPRPGLDSALLFRTPAPGEDSTHLLAQLKQLARATEDVLQPAPGSISRQQSQGVEHVSSAHQTVLETEIFRLTEECRTLRAAYAQQSQALRSITTAISALSEQRQVSEAAAQQLQSLATQAGISAANGAAQSPPAGRALGGSEAVQRLSDRVQAAEADLARDEVIFAAQAREIKALQQANADLQQQLSQQRCSPAEVQLQAQLAVLGGQVDRLSASGVALGTGRSSAPAGDATGEGEQRGGSGTPKGPSVACSPTSAAGTPLLTPRPGVRDAAGSEGGTPPLRPLQRLTASLPPEYVGNEEDQVLYDKESSSDRGRITEDGEALDIEGMVIGGRETDVDDKENASLEDQHQQHISEQQQRRRAFAVARMSLGKQLRELQFNIGQKEALIAELQTNEAAARHLSAQYLERLQELEGAIQGKEAEIEGLRAEKEAIESDRARTVEEKGRLRREVDERLARLQAAMALLKRQARDQHRQRGPAKEDKEHARARVRISALEGEVARMRGQQATLQGRVRSAAAAAGAQQEAAARQIAGLRRASSASKRRVRDLEGEVERQKTIAKGAQRKQQEASVLQQRLRSIEDAETRTDPPLTPRGRSAGLTPSSPHPASPAPPPGADPLRHKVWVEKEVQRLLQRNEAAAHLKVLLQKQAALLLQRDAKLQERSALELRASRAAQQANGADPEAAAEGAAAEVLREVEDALDGCEAELEYVRGGVEAAQAAVAAAGTAAEALRSRSEGIGLPEAKALLRCYLDALLAEAEKQRRAAARAAELEAALGEKEAAVAEGEALARLQGLEYERRTVLLQRDHARAVQQLLRQMAALSAAAPRRASEGDGEGRGDEGLGPMRRTDLQRLAKFYKEQCEGLRRELGFHRSADRGRTQQPQPHAGLPLGASLPQAPSPPGEDGAPASAGAQGSRASEGEPAQLGPGGTVTGQRQRSSSRKSSRSSVKLPGRSSVAMSHASLQQLSQGSGLQLEVVGRSTQIPMQ